MSLPIKGQHLAIFISAIKHAAVRGKKGSKCEKRLANDGREGRSWAGISAPAGASSAANATILTQKMMTATPSLYNVNKSFFLTNIEFFFSVFLTNTADNFMQV